MARDHRGVSLKRPAPGDVRGNSFTFRDQEIDRHRGVGERCSLAAEKSLGITLPLALGRRVILDTFRRQIRGGRVVTRVESLEELVRYLLVLLGRHGRALRGGRSRLLRGDKGWTEERDDEDKDRNCRPSHEPSLLREQGNAHESWTQQVQTSSYRHRITGMRFAKR